MPYKLDKLSGSEIYDRNQDGQVIWASKQGQLVYALNSDKDEYYPSETEGSDTHVHLTRYARDRNYKEIYPKKNGNEVIIGSEYAKLDTRLQKKNEYYPVKSNKEYYMMKCQNEIYARRINMISDKEEEFYAKGTNQQEIYASKRNGDEFYAVDDNYDEKYAEKAQNAMQYYASNSMGNEFYARNKSSKKAFAAKNSNDQFYYARDRHNKEIYLNENGTDIPLNHTYCKDNNENEIYPFDANHVSFYIDEQYAKYNNGAEYYRKDENNNDIPTQVYAKLDENTEYYPRKANEDEFSIENKYAIKNNFEIYPKKVDGTEFLVGQRYAKNGHEYYPKDILGNELYDRNHTIYAKKLNSEYYARVLMKEIYMKNDEQNEIYANDNTGKQILAKHGVLEYYASDKNGKQIYPKNSSKDEYYLTPPIIELFASFQGHKYKARNRNNEEIEPEQKKN